MRGKVPLFGSSFHTSRITPAYAGKSYKDNPYYIYHEDHPRLCGEKYRAVCLSCRRQGSPPPMRGKARFTALTVTCLRITPAYAGKSVDLAR